MMPKDEYLDMVNWLCNECRNVYHVELLNPPFIQSLLFLDEIAFLLGRQC